MSLRRDRCRFVLIVGGFVVRILLVGLLMGLVLVLAGCAGVSGTATTAGLSGQDRAAVVRDNLQAVLNDLTALEPAAGAAATGIELAVAPELVPVTQAISSAINVANHLAVAGVGQNPKGVQVAPPAAVGVVSVTDGSVVPGAASGSASGAAAASAGSAS
jgi:hypothetical protein